MENRGQSLSGQQSLDLIHEMIGRAKGTISSAYFYFLLWGWIVFICSLGQFLLITFTSTNKSEWIWSIVIIGVLASFWKGFKDRSNRKAMTYTARIYMTVWLTFLVNYLILLVFIAYINFYVGPIILLLAGSSTYLSGTIIKFNPLKWGAVFIWLMAIAAFFVPLPYQLLTSAAAVLIGYLIPGYMLKHNGNEA